MQVLTTHEEETHDLRLRTILLATDGSAHAHLALIAAADLAKRSGSALHLVTAYQTPPAGVYAAANDPGPEDSLDAFEGAARGLLAREKIRVESLGASVDGLHAEWGSVAEVINNVAGMVDADLILLGSRDFGTLKRVLVGSVSAHVLHTTRRPVLIVRGGANSWPPEHVIVGFDRSTRSRRAARVAASLARLYADTTMELVEVLPDLPSQAIGYFSFVDEREVEHGRLDVLAESLEHIAGHTITATQALGDPADALLARANDRTGPSLIAVGSRGFGSVRRLLLGSVSTKLLHSGHTPLLIVPAGAAAASTAAQTSHSFGWLI
jgi:nucleotide-binding universal stress UspA family protein